MGVGESTPSMALSWAWADAGSLLLGLEDRASLPGRRCGGEELHVVLGVVDGDRDDHVLVEHVGAAQARPSAARRG